MQNFERGGCIMYLTDLAEKEKLLVAEFRLCNESDKHMIMQITSEYRKSENMNSDNNT